MHSDGETMSGDVVAGEVGARAAQWCCRGVQAEPARFPGLRRALAAWAECVGMSGEQVEALALATYEALANAAIHAYPSGEGVLDVEADYQFATAEMQVVVTDYGCWQTPPDERDQLGGRGLVLIESLAEHTEVTTTASGTSVRMSWSVSPQLSMT